jgi:hypothetical protein
VKSLASDTQSQAERTYSAVQLVKSLASDAHSAAAASYSAVQLVKSLASDAQSGAAASYSRAVLATSAARAANSRALLIQSLASDTHSQAARTYSAVGDITVSLGASDVSQIAEQVASAVGAGVASQVWALSDASQCLSAAKQANARALVIQSLVSDVHSLVAAGAGGLTASQANELYAIAVAAPVIQSLASDAQSQAARTYSAAQLIKSLASDAHSQAARAYSAVLLTQSLVSDAVSQAILATSAARQANSRALLVQSLASNAHSMAAKTSSQVTAGVTLTASHLGTVADKFLGRAIAGGTDIGRTVKQALYVLRNKVIMNADSTVDVMDETDASVAWSATYSTAAGNPITKIDP